MFEKRMAIVVDPALPIGLLANTVAAISVGIGCSHPDFGGQELADLTGATFTQSANRPVPVLQASPEQLAALVQKASPVPAGGTVVIFPQFARAIHDVAAYVEELKARTIAAETIEGIGLAGPEKWVKSLTGSLKLLR